MPIDITSLWDFNDPELSEQRFREALGSASGNDVFILHTQIARTHGIRKNFDKAREILAFIEPQLASAGVEARIRYHLELGRTYCSTAHPPEIQTDSAKQNARTNYMRAFEIAEESRIDDLAIDALHMMAMVDTSPEEQLNWGLKAIAVLDASTQPAAKRWEGSLRNNVGYALHTAGRYDDALVQFKLALAERERVGKAEPIRVAHWMIAWTYSALGRIDEAIEIQLRLEKECESVGESDPYIFEELEQLYHAKGDTTRAEMYRAKLRLVRA